LQTAIPTIRPNLNLLLAETYNCDVEIVHDNLLSEQFHPDLEFFAPTRLLDLTSKNNTKWDPKGEDIYFPSDAFRTRFPPCRIAILVALYLGLGQVQVEKYLRIGKYRRLFYVAPSNIMETGEWLISSTNVFTVMVTAESKLNVIQHLPLL